MTTIPKAPFYLSLVKQEFGSEWVSQCGKKAGLTPPFFCSEFAGKSDVFIITIANSNHIFDPNGLVSAMALACNHVWASAKFRIIIQPGVQLVCASSTNFCMWFGGAMQFCDSIVLENHGWILGRGGNGGDVAEHSGRGGGAGIYVGEGVTLTIDNRGIISGGGGGGGAATMIWQGDASTVFGGSGGAPLGFRGMGTEGAEFDGNDANVLNGSAAVALSDEFLMGAGGDIGWVGGAGTGLSGLHASRNLGGAGGSAIVSVDSTVKFINIGDIRGSYPST